MTKLSLSSVSVNFGRAKALDDVTLTLDSGIVALVGPNGSGKSTLLDVLSGFIDYQSGVILDSFHRRLKPRDLTKVSCRLHQRNVLPEELIVSEFLTIASQPNDSQYLTLKRWKREDNIEGARLRNLWRDMNLEVGWASTLSSLSVGERRIISLLAVLASQKQVILLDEPFTGLSPTVISSAKRVISEFSRESLIIVAEHDIEEVVEIADRLVVLAAGRVVLDRRSDEVQPEALLSYFG